MKKMRDENVLVEELYRLSKVIAIKLDVAVGIREDVVQNTVVELFTSKFKSTEELYRVVDESFENKTTSNFLFTITKNAMIDCLRNYNKNTHCGLIYNDSNDDSNSTAVNEYHNMSSNLNIDESFMLVKELIEKVGTETTEGKYLIAKSYFEGVNGINELMNDSLKEAVSRIEVSTSGKFKKNSYEVELLYELGLGYAGNSKARKFKNELRKKLINLGVR